ncbi:hypothetical protein E2C01_065412 [Portunus trituberculatus]|uniref:Uncharacterized protein n=1 Tax=Portunus trituberculatus TaxID=210409 RepID=A0A5B7HIR8_PORTR|nr:hypothetical protein [Portunus trituberculatus]
MVNTNNSSFLNLPHHICSSLTDKALYCILISTPSVLGHFSIFILLTVW